VGMGTTPKGARVRLTVSHSLIGGYGCAVSP
jgi:hypothetical protein